jgi:hypothetical protein
MALSKSERAVVAAAFLAVAGVLAFFFQPLDGYGGWALSVLAQKEDTVYSPNYSDSGFRKIAVGMTEAEVVQLVGKPLEVYSVDKEGKQCTGWRFSRTTKGASYRMRSVLFSDGRVTEIFREFYLD